MSYNTIKAAREAARLWSWKDPVRISIASAGVTFAGEQTLDGVALVNGDALLVEDGVEGGIRLVQDGAWARREDARFLGSLRHGTSVRVLEGTNAGIVYQLDTAGDIEPGVTSMTWSQEAGGAGSVSSPVDTITEDATPVTLATLTAAEDGARLWEVSVTATESGSGDVKVWTVLVAAKLASGIAAFVSGSAPVPTVVDADAGFGAATFTLGVDGSTGVEIIATGEAATDISWRTRIRRVV
jgi:hypothetical protein